jgi:hypothetical protein
VSPSQSHQDLIITIEADKTRFRSRYSSKILTVLVGPEREPFYVHAEALNATSNLFKRATGDIVLADMCNEAFRAYLEWVYTREIKPARDIYDRWQNVPSNQLIMLWLIGNCFEDVTLNNEAMSLLEKESRPKDGLLRRSTIAKIFQKSGVDSGLGRWTVDHVARHASSERFRELRGELSA